MSNVESRRSRAECGSDARYFPCDDEGQPLSHDQPESARDLDDLAAPAIDADNLDAAPFTPIQPPMVISLAKREEEVYIQARSAPVRLSRNNPALRLLQQMRDEAHRFAQHYHHLLRTKATFDEDVRHGRRPPGRKQRS
jgi:hypothetical protein